MKLTATEMIPVGQDKMLRPVYLKIAGYQIKCLYLSFTYVQAPKEMCSIEAVMQSMPLL